MLGRRSSRASDGVSVRAETVSGEGGRMGGWRRWWWWVRLRM